MKFIFYLAILFSVLFVFSCKKEISEEPKISNPKITIETSKTYQEMTGFGGALTWYSDRIISSPKSNEICQLLFDDLGMDILRLKNWYYPTDYPNNKSPQTMVTTGDKTMFDATNQFYTKAKTSNPNIKILLSSWGPPASLKSNNNLNEGTLKKNANDQFMYDEFAQYWIDILDNISFTPDYISIQNEPSYINAGWTTCMWSSTETSLYPGYNTAFQKVHDRIASRANSPEMIGPESANNTAFENFAPALKNLDYCKAYAYHTYSFNQSTDYNTIKNTLQNIPYSFDNKPCFMTEYSGMSWLKTARLIQYNLIYANASAYVYWDMVWGDANTKDNAMIYIDYSGNYTVNSFYYLVKHFSKFIDRGYQRINVTTKYSNVDISGFINPAKTQITLIVVNDEAGQINFDFEIDNYNILGIKGFQSVEGNYFKDMGSLTPDSGVALPAHSISTLVLDIN